MHSADDVDFMTLTLRNNPPLFNLPVLLICLISLCLQMALELAG